MYFSNADLGYYVVAYTIATAGLGLVTHSVHTVLFPIMASDPIRSSAIARLRGGLRRSVLFLFLGSIFALVLVPIFLPILFGESYRPAVSIAMFLVVAFIPLALRQIISRCLRALGDARAGFLAELLALIGFGVLIFPAMSQCGTLGIPLALLFGNTISLVGLSSILRRQYAIPTSAWLLPNGETLADVRKLLHRR
jgi:O-antigen/teichoic acid export membrane protein